MDLPKNITQIGEADEVCKIYVEDYVVSYLKQLNPLARDKTMAAALYGKRKTEDGVNYLFVYGAGKVDFIQKEVRHLSQAQKQEIERIRKQYFADYELLGYRILDGGAVGGFHVCEQDACRYVDGYAQFYEKNEAMLSYMLESRQAEAEPEHVDVEKYDAARNRQEKRREKFARKEAEQEAAAAVTKEQKGGLRVAFASVLVLLCALGLTVNSSKLSEYGFSWDKLKTELGKAGLSELTAASGQEQQTASAQIPSLPELAHPISREDQAAWGNRETEAEQGEPSKEASLEKILPTSGKVETGPAEEQSPDVTENAEQAQMTTQATPEPEEIGSESKEPTVYVVKKGDTLSGISIRTYGSERFVAQICQLNGIKNPDEIKEGQKILLP